MRIKSITAAPINKIKLIPGIINVRNDLDPSDPLTVIQLRTLRENGLISFDEILPGDEKLEERKKLAAKVSENHEKAKVRTAKRRKELAEKKGKKDVRGAGKKPKKA